MMASSACMKFSLFHLDTVAHKHSEWQHCGKIRRTAHCRPDIMICLLSKYNLNSFVLVQIFSQESHIMLQTTGRKGW